MSAVPCCLVALLPRCLVALGTARHHASVSLALVYGLLSSLLAGCDSPPITLSTIFLRPTPDVVGSPADYGFEFDELLVPVAEGREVSIWHVKAANPKGIVAIFPGSDRNKSRYLIALPVFIPNGYDVILMDYEGFGASTGGPLDLQRLTDDGFAVADFAKTLHEKVVLFGISTGASIAVSTAGERDAAALMLEAPLVLDDEVELWLRGHGVEDSGLWEIANLWTHPQIPDSFNIIQNIKSVTEPKLIMQSVEDDAVPFAAGLAVYEAAPEPKTFFEMRGGHGKMIELEPELYTQTIISWLDATLQSD